MKRAYLILLTLLLPMVSWATEYYTANSKGGGNFADEIWTTSADGSGSLADTTGIFNTSNNFTILSGHSVSCPSKELDIGDLTVKGTLTEFIVSLNDINIQNLVIEGTINFASSLIDGNFNVVNYFALDGSNVIFANNLMNYNVSGYFYIGTTSTFNYSNSAENKISGNGRFDEYVNPLVTVISDKGVVYANDQVVSTNLSDFPTDFLNEEATIQLNKDHTLTIDQAIGSDLSFSAGFTTSPGNNGSITFSTNASGTFKTADTNPFNDIVVNTNTSVTLGGDFYMGGELTLTNGVINGGGNRFVINSGGSINSATYSTSLGSIASGGSDASHINGQMSMTFATTGNYTLLPVGDGTNLREAGVQNLAATAAHTLTVTYNNTSHGTSTLDPGLNEVEVSNVEYWDINVSGTDQTGFTENFKVVISYNSSSLIDETKSGTLHLFHYSSGDSHWDSEADGTHGDFTIQSSGGGKGFISAQTLTFSPFTFGGGSDHDLSVALSNFSASPNNKQVDISWSTATEINNSHFDIERSSDQKSWEVIERVDAKGGNSSVSIDYEFTDERPLQNAYYRLVQYDLDGTSETFGPIQVSLISMANEFKAELHPNVFDRSQAIKLALEGLTKGSDILIQVYDHHGNLVVDQIIEQTSEENILQEFKIPGHLPAGMYHLNVSSGVKISRSKFVLH
ncbi:hypothetical protein KMW28_02245 [Flammeovirga yaeyamensis]|uniref:Secretion system C-terminal sorting domain-containing protein n=1 Tax=Flammeovirga yaeyamensis TaxID=367791 RepID=A0AAX1N7M2_9BACT|nr:hypothetical protein [Flammeovirga yaeyamensis]MBB3700343.1 hypothetical protein [Flammeovirga yaeyamensis]NMF37031.1 hypothetical protein [Flammeovirga yaeyamensis]QWG02426.1 hypothetical protein KMW28_02245 [Flammeovirga yaeyamensis]